MFGFDTPVEETVFYKEVIQEGLDKKEKQAINAFEIHLKGQLERGVISKEDYQQEASAFRARLADKQGEA